MLELQRGDLLLKRIGEEDIELIRQWRNSEDVKQFMEFREYIDEMMQLQWFTRINNKSNLYFIIYSGGQPIGLIYGADMDWNNRTVGNAGIFIASKEHRENRFALEASLLVNDFAFASGFETIYIRVLRSNKVARSYNQLLGYKLLPEQNEIENQQYILYKKDYQSRRKKLNDLLKIAVSFTVRTTLGTETAETSISARLHEHIFLQDGGW